MEVESHLFVEETHLPRGHCPRNHVSSRTPGSVLLSVPPPHVASSSCSQSSLLWGMYMGTLTNPIYSPQRTPFPVDLGRFWSGSWPSHIGKLDGGRGGSYYAIFVQVVTLFGSDPRGWTDSRAEGKASSWSLLLDRFGGLRSFPGHPCME